MSKKGFGIITDERDRDWEVSFIYETGEFEIEDVRVNFNSSSKRYLDFEGQEAHDLFNRYFDSYDVETLVEQFEDSVEEDWFDDEKELDI